MKSFELLVRIKKVFLDEKIDNLFLMGIKEGSLKKLKYFG